ncbi:MAG: GNAT family N-acetyltransferase [Acidimicrobiales bacterium]
MRPDELAELSAVERDADRRFDRFGMGLEPSRTVAERGEPALRVLVHGDPPVGFIWLVELCDRPHVEELAVRCENGRRGIGRALLEASCSWAAGVGHGALTLCTFRDVPWNGPFYRSAGFLELEETAWCHELQALRGQERAAGLDAFGDRVVMIRQLRQVLTTGSTTRDGR